MEAFELKCEYIPENNINLESPELIDSHIEYHNLKSSNLTSSQVQRASDIANLLGEITDNSTKFYYDRPKRSETEFAGGYKIALHRGAKLMK